MTSEYRDTHARLLLSTKEQLVIFCPPDIHVDLNESEDNGRVYSCSWLTTSESLAMNMMQQRE